MLPPRLKAIRRIALVLRGRGLVFSFSRIAPVVALAVALAGAAIVTSACSDPAGESSNAGDTSPASDAAGVDAIVKDTFFNNWNQGYTLRMRFHGGPADGVEIDLERDLFGNQTVFAFGSTHLAPPALALSVQESIQYPAGGTTVPLEIVFNFGLLIGNAEYDAHTTKTADYPFSCTPPMVKIFFKGFWYKSTCPDLAGHIDVTDHTTEQGGRFAGTVQGTLHAWFPKISQAEADDCNPEHTALTCQVKEPDWTVDVDGYFGFELPPKDGKD